MNNDLCIYLLYLGRQNRDKARLLGPWIPKIRTWPQKITEITKLDFLPDQIAKEVEQGPKELAQNSINKYQPIRKTAKELEFERLVKTLPKELRLRIFGYAIQCYSCFKRMYKFSTDDLSQKWLLIYNKNFCSKLCLAKYQNNGGAGGTTLIDQLVAAAGVISDERACLLRIECDGGCRCWG